MMDIRLVQICVFAPVRSKLSPSLRTRVRERKWMLEAEIKDDTLLSRARADSERGRNAGHDLQTPVQIVRPANPRTHIKIL